ncbi:hypothetical protein RCL1_006438 [Eukaryota sp. TZLM3-RCL]
MSLCFTTDILSSRKSLTTTLLPSYCALPQQDTSFIKKCIDKYYGSHGHPRKLSSSRPLRLATLLQDFENLLSSEKCISIRWPVKDSVQFLFEKGDLVTMRLSVHTGISHIQIDHLISPSLHLTISSASFSLHSSYIVLGYSSDSFVHILSSSAPVFTINLPSPAVHVFFIKDYCSILTTNKLFLYSNKNSETFVEINSIEQQKMVFVYSFLIRISSSLLLIVLISKNLVQFFTLLDGQNSKIKSQNSQDLSVVVTCKPVVIKNFIFLTYIKNSKNFVAVFDCSILSIILERELSSFPTAITTENDWFFVAVGLKSGAIVFFDLALNQLSIVAEGLQSFNNHEFILPVDSDCFPSLIKFNEDKIISIVYSNAICALLFVPTDLQFFEKYLLTLFNSKSFEVLTNLLSIVLKIADSGGALYSGFSNFLIQVYSNCHFRVFGSNGQWSNLIEFFDCLLDLVKNMIEPDSNLLTLSQCVLDQVLTYQIASGS